MFKVIFSPLLVFMLITITGIKPSFAQDEKNKFIGITSGGSFFYCEVPEHDFIRGDFPTYFSSDIAKELNGYAYKWNAGLEAEFRLMSNLGITTGILFTNYNSILGKSTNNSDNDKFFYLMAKQQGTNTDYYKVKKVTQHNKYIGIPLAIKYLYGSPRKVMFYNKVSAEFDYRIGTSGDAVFYNEAMDPYTDDVTDRFGVPGDFLSSVQLSIGLNIGKDDHTNVNLEFVFLTFLIKNNASTLVNPLAGSGLQLSIVLPY